MTRKRKTIVLLAIVLASACSAVYLAVRSTSEVAATDAVARVLLTDLCAKKIVEVIGNMRGIRGDPDEPSLQIVEFDSLPRELDQFVGFAEIRSSADLAQIVESAVRRTYLECSATSYLSISLDDPQLATRLNGELRRQELRGYVGTNVRIVDGASLEVFGVAQNVSIRSPQ